MEVIRPNLFGKGFRLSATDSFTERYNRVLEVAAMTHHYPV